MYLNEWMCKNDKAYDRLCQYGPGHAIAEYAARVCYRSLKNAGRKETYLTGLATDRHLSVFEHAGWRVYGYNDLISSLEVAKYVPMLHDGTAYVSGRTSYELQNIGIQAMPAMIGKTPPLAKPDYLYYPPVETDEGPVVTLLALDEKRFDDGLGRAVFLVKNVSRNMTHQLVRHRLFSFSQESQRYVSAQKADWGPVIPPTWTEDQISRYKVWFDQALLMYEQLLSERDKNDKPILKQDARFVLPTGLETTIVFSGDKTALNHFFKLRTERSAQWEIRAVANAALKILDDLTWGIKWL